MCNNHKIEQELNNKKKYTNPHYEARIRNQRDFYIDKDLMIQYVNELEGIKEQIIPEFDEDRFNNLPDNALLKVKPELYYEWDFVKNNELGINVWEATKGQVKKVWWICPKCGSSYEASIDKRSAGRKCSYCKSSKINHTNSLASRNPKLASEWHPTKNNRTPYETPLNYNKKVWWLGECGHEWETTPNARNYNSNNCIYCVNQKILIGFNDMWTTNPELAKLLLNPEDGHKYMQSSGQRVDWRCPQCNNIVKDKRISTVKNNGLSCPECSDGISYPEKFMYNLLKQLNVDFIYQKTFDFLPKNRYDFYVPNINMIIETNGEQHIREYNRRGARTLEEEQANDKLKYDTAIANGIKEYIVIDCRKSNLEWIKDNILKSNLINVFNLNNIDWIKIDNESQKSAYLEAIKLWNSGNFSSAKEVSIELKISLSAVARFLNRGTKNGLCYYDGKNSLKISGKKRAKPIIQISLGGCYIKEFPDVKDILESNIIGVEDRTSIVDCCLGNRKTYGNFKWMYKCDYEKRLRGENVVINKRKGKEIIQLDLEGNYIREWESISDAGRSIDISSTGISAVCRGKKITAKGYKWMYKDDYEKLNM